MAVTDPRPKRPWWRRKRTWAALALWLLLTYPLSMGPASYAVRRRWVSIQAYRAVYWPVIETDLRLDPDRLNRFARFHRYMRWWNDRARDRANDASE